MKRIARALEAAGYLSAIVAGFLVHPALGFACTAGSAFAYARELA